MIFDWILINGAKLRKIDFKHNAIMVMKTVNRSKL